MRVVTASQKLSDEYDAAVAADACEDVVKYARSLNAKRTLCCVHVFSELDLPKAPLHCPGALRDGGAPAALLRECEVLAPSQAVRE